MCAVLMYCTYSWVYTSRKIFLLEYKINSPFNVQNMMEFLGYFQHWITVHISLSLFPGKYESVSENELASCYFFNYFITCNMTEDMEKLVKWILGKYKLCKLFKLIQENLIRRSSNNDMYIYILWGMLEYFCVRFLELAKIGRSPVKSQK